MQLSLSIKNHEGATLKETQGIDEIYLVYEEEYVEGDYILLQVETPGFYEVCFEDSMPKTIVYISGAQVKYRIPFGMDRIAYSPRAFSSVQHLISVSAANEAIVTARRNLALNPFDAHGDTGMFPHASANVETRNEALFAARNAIDGIHANYNHYPYPFQSWGINQDANAELLVEFGANVNIELIRLVLRADFPHDNYWTQTTFEFSDGTSEIVDLAKTDKPQSFQIMKKDISWLKLKNLIASDDPSPFPALRQIEAWGTVKQP